MQMTILDKVAMALLIVGGLNWGMVGLAEFNLVTTIFGEETTLTTVVYAVVGLAALYSTYSAIMMSTKKQ